MLDEQSPFSRSTFAQRQQAMGVALEAKCLSWRRLGIEPGRNRTFNPLIKSQLLCQLSYWPT